MGRVFVRSRGGQPGFCQVVPFHEAAQGHYPPLGQGRGGSVVPFTTPHQATPPSTVQVVLGTARRRRSEHRRTQPRS